MDRQHIQDREKWKREMAQKIKETKIQMMKLTGGWAGVTGQEGIRGAEGPKAWQGWSQLEGACWLA